LRLLYSIRDKRYKVDLRENLPIIAPAEFVSELREDL